MADDRSENRKEFTPEQPIAVQLTQDKEYLEPGIFGRYLRRDLAFVFTQITGWIRVPLDHVFQTQNSEITL